MHACNGDVGGCVASLITPSQAGTLRVCLCSGRGLCHRHLYIIRRGQGAMCLLAVQTCIHTSIFSLVSSHFFLSPPPHSISLTSQTKEGDVRSSVMQRTGDPYVPKLKAAQELLKEAQKNYFFFPFALRYVRLCSCGVLLLMCLV